MANETHTKSQAQCENFAEFIGFCYKFCLTMISFHLEIGPFLLILQKQSIPFRQNIKKYPNKDIKINHLFKSDKNRQNIQFYPTNNPIYFIFRLTSLNLQPPYLLKPCHKNRNEIYLWEIHIKITFLSEK